MKTLLILALLIALAAAAFFTKPTQADFKQYIQQQQDQGLSLKGIVGSLETNRYLNSVVFHNRILWVTVTKDGQPQYLGVFGHWFKQTPTAGQSAGTP
jgi:hypothetical protein